MKYLKLGISIIAICLFSCNRTDKHQKSTRADTTKKIKSPVISSSQNDNEEIQNLIRNMLAWSDSKNRVLLVPVITNGKDSIYTSFDLNELKANLEKLKATNFFSAEFIENYKQIILTLDQEMKDKKFSPWSTGELPPFNFANDVNPWCDCQDNSSWSAIKVCVVNLNNESGELYWKWGDLDANASADWKDFRYKFKVKKEDGKWKISYMEGFDFNDSIKS
ncbi:MAG TPA: hypothetical protein VGI43_01585 [Mucilaginibacter sp.]|jgi:hypothetical protein